jgi:hypothetical protein
VPELGVAASPHCAASSAAPAAYAAGLLDKLVEEECSDSEPDAAAALPAAPVAVGDVPVAVSELDVAAGASTCASMEFAVHGEVGKVVDDACEEAYGAREEEAREEEVEEEQPLSRPAWSSSPPPPLQHTPGAPPSVPNAACGIFAANSEGPHKSTSATGASEAPAAPALASVLSAAGGSVAAREGPAKTLPLPQPAQNKASTVSSQRRRRKGAGDSGGVSAVGLRPGDEVVLQEYVQPPMLIGRRKFDVRCFCMVASVRPTLILRHELFYLRRSCEPFDLGDLGRRGAHLTNICVQKHHPNFGEDCVWDGVQLDHFLRQRGGPASLESINAAIDSLMTLCLQAVLPHLSERRGCFQLLGFDVLLDSAGAVSLLEINRNPDLQAHTRTLYRLLPQLVDDTLQVAIEVNLSLAEGKTLLWPLDSKTGYTCLLSDP